MTTPSNKHAAAVTSQAEHGPAPPIADDPKKDVFVTPAANVPLEDMTEERIEYRDEEGNLLNEEDVKSLEGKVSFSTRYETRTRLVDQFGREIADGAEGEEQGFAGTSADGVDPGTENAKGEGQASPVPPKVAAKDDVSKEKAKVDDVKATPEPESEVGKQTGKDEL